MGGYKVQGRQEAAADKLREDAAAVADAGAALLVLEGVPSSLAQAITAASAIPTIGIGAGPHCDGQVLVLHDVLGLHSGHRRPKFRSEGHTSELQSPMRIYYAVFCLKKTTDNRKQN